MLWRGQSWPPCLHSAGTWGPPKRVHLGARGSENSARELSDLPHGLSRKTQYADISFNQVAYFHPQTMGLKNALPHTEEDLDEYGGGFISCSLWWFGGWMVTSGTAPS
jgi:hypothetical protein